MSKKIFVGIVIFIITICSVFSVSYGKKIQPKEWGQPLHLKIFERNKNPLEYGKNVDFKKSNNKKYLKETFGYDDVIKDKMIINTKIKIIKGPSPIFKRYDIQIGEGKDAYIKKSISKGDLEKKYGYYGENQWNIKGVIRYNIDPNVDNGIMGYFDLTEIYTEEDIDVEIPDDGKNIEDYFDEMYNYNVFKQAAKWVLDEIWQLIEKCLISLIQLIVDLGDILMKLLNYVELEKFGLTGNGISKMVYSPSELNGKKKIDEYIKFESAPSETDYKVTIYNNGEGIDKDNAQIPFIPVEMYTISSDKVAGFDANFLVVDKNLHPDDSSLWNKTRNFIAVFLRILYFVCSATLVGTLIWHGMNVVWFTIDQPKEKKEHIDGIQRFGKSLLLLIGALLIIGLSIYGSREFLTGFVNLPAGKEFPIRVTAKEADLKFSTNYTGYLRYMAQINEPDFHAQKFEYALKYFLMVIVSWIVAISMFIRMVVIFALSFLGPPIAVWYAFGSEKAKSFYKIWYRTFIIVSVVQAVFLLLCIAVFEYGLD